MLAHPQPLKPSPWQLSMLGLSADTGTNLSWPLRYCLAAAVPTLMVLAPGPAPVVAQSQTRQPDANAVPHAILGLPIYTSDGKAIGKVVATGVDADNAPVLVAEISRPLGIGPQAIAIPTDLFVPKPGRIELTITEAEVNARIGRKR
jgi:PRC-barrel domain protein